MKKTILAIATILTLTVGNSFAQRYHHEVPAMNNSRSDNAFDEFKINKLDEIVKLSRKQENKIKKIEDHYDQLTSSNRRFTSFQSVQRLEKAKQKDILEVLTPAQRQRLFAYQNSYNNGRYNRRG
jgi:Spy/CpxP family protein refolding chaperone